MKTKSNTLRMIGLLAIMLSIFISGCGDKGVGPNQETGGSVIGQWDLTGIKSTTGGQTYEVPRQEIEADPLTYIFYSDHTGEIIFQSGEFDITWTSKGSTLTLSYYSETMSCTYSANSTTLTMSFTEDIYRITHIFKKQ